MSDQTRPTLDAAAREALLSALFDGGALDPVSDEDLTVVAEHGMESFDEQHRERLLYAMCKDINGASGTLDVYRLLQSQSAVPAPISETPDESDLKLVSSTTEISKRLDFCSRLLTGVWAAAACVALYFGIWSTSVRENQTNPIEQWTSEHRQQLRDEGLFNDLESLLQQLQEYQLDQHTKKGLLGQPENPNYWLVGALVVLVLVPPILVVHRKRLARH